MNTASDVIDVSEMSSGDGLSFRPASDCLLTLHNGSFLVVSYRMAWQIEHFLTGVQLSNGRFQLFALVKSGSTHLAMSSR